MPSQSIMIDETILEHSDTPGQARTKRTAGHPFFVLPDGQVLGSAAGTAAFGAGQSPGIDTGHKAAIGTQFDPQKGDEDCCEEADALMPIVTGHFWPRQHLAGCSLHLVAHGAPINPLMARFFIDRLTRSGEIVYDPRMGRGTVPLEAALRGRIPFGNDLDPLSAMLVEPRLKPQWIGHAMGRLHGWCQDCWRHLPDDLLAFFHPQTLGDLLMIKDYLLPLQEQKCMDDLDRWIRLLVLACFTNQRDDYFIGPTIHPNTVMLPSRRHRPDAPPDCHLPKKEVYAALDKMSERLLRDVDQVVRQRLAAIADRAIISTGPAESTPEIQDNSVSLVITRPPSLSAEIGDDADRLRRWFVDVEPARVAGPNDIENWAEQVHKMLAEMRRVLKPGGHLVIEVGRLRPRKLKLQALMIEVCKETGFEPVCAFVNPPNRNPEYQDVMLMQKRGGHGWVRTDAKAFSKPLGKTETPAKQSPPQHSDEWRHPWPREFGESLADNLAKTGQTLTESKMNGTNSSGEYSAKSTTARSPAARSGQHNKGCPPSEPPFSNVNGAANEAMPPAAVLDSNLAEDDIKITLVAEVHGRTKRFVKNLEFHTTTCAGARGENHGFLIKDLRDLCEQVHQVVTVKLDGELNPAPKSAGASESSNQKRTQEHQFRRSGGSNFHSRESLQNFILGHLEGFRQES